MKKDEKTRQDLLQIAYKLFLEKGYENTSVDTIIAEAKIAKGTYYYYVRPYKKEFYGNVYGKYTAKKIKKK